MRNKIGLVSMGLGVVFIVMALSLFVINWKEDYEAGKSADIILGQLEDVNQEYKNDISDPYDFVMKEYNVDGNSYIGYLYFESLDLKLPVMSNWSYSQLKMAPCRYFGATKTDDLVIMAHNYKKHFGQLKKLSLDELIVFTDMRGKVFKYKVVAVEILGALAVNDMNSGKYDLTLFTCTYGGKNRVVVRCDMI